MYTNEIKFKLNEFAKKTGMITTSRFFMCVCVSQKHTILKSNATLICGDQPERMRIIDRK